MKVAIIGAGAAGLASIRRAIEHNLECLAFEATDEIGGVWVYHRDGELIPRLQNNMYKTLRINLSTQLMEFVGYDRKVVLVSQATKKCSSTLNDLPATSNKENSSLQFNCEVMKVRRWNGVWEIEVKNWNTMSSKKYNFDAVMVCSGHYNKPYLPNILEMDTFTGHGIHSRFYHDNESYLGKSVLVIGNGSSGLDLAVECEKVAKKVIFCYRNKPSECLNSVPNILQKPQVQFVNKNIVTFQDDSSEEIDAVIYCTGYTYEFPFFNSSCEIVMKDGIVQPVCKHFMNINQPTMCFVDLLRGPLTFTLWDIQGKVFMKLLTNEVERPSKECMLLRLERQHKKRKNENVKNSAYYILNLEQMKKYVIDLCDTGNIKHLPEVIFNISKAISISANENHVYFKNYNYIILDDVNFKCCKIRD